MVGCEHQGNKPVIHECVVVIDTMLTEQPQNVNMALHRCSEQRSRPHPFVGVVLETIGTRTKNKGKALKNKAET